MPPALCKRGFRRIMKTPAIPVLLTLLQLAWLEAARPGDGLLAGTGAVDITPAGPVALAGSPAPKQSAQASTPLFVKALVLATGTVKSAVVTVDTLKYPAQHVERARRQIEQNTGIPAGHVVICASHTHSGPLWSHYPDQLVTPITEAVMQAARSLAPCRAAVARGQATGVSECRRVIRDGHAWNRWQLPPAQMSAYPAEGPADPACEVLALTGEDNRYKAILYNFACHAANNRDFTISADYPGDVQRHLEARLGYAVPALFLPGACGDVNPIYTVPRQALGEALGKTILDCLSRLEPLPTPALAVESREIRMPGREQPEFAEDEIARNWPAQLEHYRKSFLDMRKRERPDYPCSLTGIRLGPGFALVTNPTELFCAVGMSIKERSPFGHTMVAEQTNGAHGYVPTRIAFQNGSYETWFGEHSYLTTEAGAIIERESLDILQRLRRPE